MERDVCYVGARERFGAPADVNTTLNSGMHSRAEWLRLLRAPNESRLGADMRESWRLYVSATREEEGRKRDSNEDDFDGGSAGAVHTPRARKRVKFEPRAQLLAAADASENDSAGPKDAGEFDDKCEAGRSDEIERSTTSRLKRKTISPLQFMTINIGD
mmetsp:Transcript_13977/g.37528  ORF Transcript_13977/g.37528 Transcript_13977/m.37528 type:complete len:159 (-) Transcript_13977:873-1349(-)